ncbi:type II secretion system F family protein [Candidatus Woesearchaeota archaeon]|nr:type II secretion system F family protein [Candidatus Woesearchaeota archaeon]
MKEIDSIFELVNELEKLLSFRNGLIVKVKELDREYQTKKYDYFEYKKRLLKLLKDRALEDWVSYFDSQIFDLLEKIKILNTSIFYQVYKGKLPEKRAKPVPAVQEPVYVQKPAPKPAAKPAAKLAKPLPPKPVIEIKHEAERVVEKPAIEVPRKPEPRPDIVEISGKAIEVTEKPRAAKPLRVQKPDAAEVEELKAKVEKGAKPEFTAKELAKRAESMEKIGAVEKGLKMYKPSLVGTIANKYFRKIGDYMTAKYPDSFSRLFKALRYANMKVLSNTYVDIILLVTWLVFMFSFLIIFLIGFVNPNVFTLFIRPLVIALLLSVIAFIVAYAYPYIKADQRRKLIEANLPFAINHMAAVATSGLPPFMMFKIVSQSKEYSEIGVELKRLVEYIDFFGYDLTTAMQVVSNSSPSREFKEFLDGAIATLTSGGDFDYFLKEKSDQAMFAYRLRKEKYNETISTYSDIYMGVMIVAPVFFIAILSLVSILGGTILGLNVNTIVVFGTYALIPMLNILFLLYLEVTQPVD